MKFILFLILICSIQVTAQIRIEGKVTDSNKNVVQSANIFIVGTYDGGTTDTTGYFSFLTYNVGNQILKITAIGRESKSVAIDLAKIKSLLTYPVHSYKERFSIKIGQSIKIVETSTVNYFYSENKGTYCLTADQHHYLIDLSLDQVEQLLDPNSFFRINRSQLINMKHIKEIAIHTNSRLRVYLYRDQKAVMIVSREKVNDFKKWLDR